MLMLERPAEVSAALNSVVARAAGSTPIERGRRRRRARSREGYDKAA
jgi:hypothetical protein